MTFSVNFTDDFFVFEYDLTDFVDVVVVPFAIPVDIAVLLLDILHIVSNFLIAVVVVVQHMNDTFCLFCRYR
jgi:hypothetical protein